MQSFFWWTRRGSKLRFVRLLRKPIAFYVGCGSATGKPPQHRRKSSLLFLSFASIRKKTANFSLAVFLLVDPKRIEASLRSLASQAYRILCRLRLCHRQTAATSTKEFAPLFKFCVNKKKDCKLFACSLSFGGPEEDRTLDLTDANRTLSQLSYGPEQ